MGGLIELAISVLAESGKTGGAGTTAIRMASAALCAGLAAVAMLAALGCAATALWMFTLPTHGPIGALLVVAAALSTVTLILASAVWLIVRYRRQKPRAAILPQSILSEAARLFSEHKVAVLLAAVVAGMAAANDRRKS